MAQRLLERTVCSVQFLVVELIHSDGLALLGAETSLKRFWKTVDIANVGDGLAVTLDNRPLKTPSGNRLQLPQNKCILAMLVATEWETQDKILKTHALPMVSVSACWTAFTNVSNQTSLVSRAIDAMRDESTRAQAREALLKYLDTDTIWYVFV